MEASRWVLIDGLPGSGKSTSGELLAQQLEAGGLAAQVYSETSLTHPLHVVPPEEKSAAWADIHLQLTAQEFAERSLDRWRTFLASRLPGWHILESYPFQSSVRVLVQMDAGDDVVTAYWEAWRRLIEREASALVYFHEPQPLALLREAMDKRGPGWTAMMLRAFEQMPYAANRGWSGEQAALGLITAYAQIMERLVATVNPPAIMLEARPASYAERQDRLYKALGLTD